MLEYDLTNRGDEPVWMPNEDGGYALETVPVYLKWEPTRTTTRPLGYLLPPSMAPILPRLMDHDIAVYGFEKPTTIAVEVYYATEVRRDNYFQGHYLQSVSVEKEQEQIEVGQGWYYIPTAQSRANLISYLMEPETDDNLITWNWTDHVLQVSPESVEEVLAGMMGGRDASQMDPEQLERMRGFARQRMEQRQQVPMMRVVEAQDLPIVRVAPFNEYQRNRYFRTY